MALLFLLSCSTKARIYINFIEMARWRKSLMLPKYEKRSKA
jgi:hypothetical protein